MTQAQIDALPKHLEGIRFENWHFYYNKKAKKGENALLLQDNFIDDVMRVKNIHFTPEITRVIHIEGDKFYIEAKVTVYNQGPMVGTNQKNTTAFASMTRMPHDSGQTHYAQMCITRALRTAVLRHLGISDHDIQLAIEAYEISLKNVSTMARSVTEDEPEEVKQEDAIISEVDLGDLGV